MHKSQRFCKFADTINQKIRVVTPTFAICLVLILLFYAIGVGNIDLFDWDEINFAEIGREMTVSGNWWQPTIDFLPFHEKPPLFVWLQAISFQCFGVNSAAARLPNLLCGALSLTAIFYLGRRWVSLKFAWWWAAFMAFSILPQIYFRSGIIDPWFNLFTFLSLACLIHPLGKLPGLKQLLLAGLLLGLAVLTKGPVATLVVGITLAVVCWFDRRRFRQLWYRYALVGLLSLLPIGIWIAVVWQQDDGFFAREFLRYQWRLFVQEDAGHGGFPGYHLVVLTFGCFPAATFAWPQLISTTAKRIITPQRMTRYLFWVVLILFSIVNTKIVHYSSLAYFPLTYLAAETVIGVQRGTFSMPRWAHWLTLGIWSIYGVLLCGLPLAVDHLLPQWLEVGEELQSSIVYGVSNVSGYFLLALPFLPMICLLHRWWKRSDIRAYAIGNFSLAIYSVVVVLVFYIGQIQKVTQGANVAFFKEQASKDVYYGMAYRKSYAPLFYGRISPETGARAREWRFHGAIDKDLYFASPLSRTERVLSEVPDARLLYSEGGFSFYLRPAMSAPE